MSTGDTWELGRRPALDGLRGVAILLVVVGHTANWFAPGTVGVAVFFTLSGFLITNLLLVQLQRDGRVSLGRFYARRARRLFPALAVLLAAVALLGAASGGAILAAALYFSNWYAAAGHPTGLLSHTWSLAVEEQFYLAWPLVILALGRRRRLLVAVTAGGALAAVGLRLAALDAGATGGQVVRWTHTRADALLIGCALAVLLHHGRARPSRPRVAVAAGLSLAPLSLTSPAAGWTWVPTLVPLVTALIIWAVVTGPYAGWLTWDPLRDTGRISYGWYLWHPVTNYLVLQLGVTVPTSVAMVLAAAASLLIAIASYRYVEQPFLRRNDARVTEAGAASAAPARAPER